MKTYTASKDYSQKIYHKLFRCASPACLQTVSKSVSQWVSDTFSRSPVSTVSEVLTFSKSQLSQKSHRLTVSTVLKSQLSQKFQLSRKSHRLNSLDSLDRLTVYSTVSTVSIISTVLTVATISTTQQSQIQIYHSMRILLVAIESTEFCELILSCLHFLDNSQKPPPK